MERQQWRDKKQQTLPDRKQNKAQGLVSMEEKEELNP